GTSSIVVPSLSASTLYPARVEFYDINTNGSVVLNWKPGNTGNFALIPTTNFFRDSAGTTAGVIGTYWTNTAFLGTPSYADYQTQINYNKGSGQPGNTWTVTNF